MPHREEPRRASLRSEPKGCACNNPTPEDALRRRVLIWRDERDNTTHWLDCSLLDFPMDDEGDALP
jgi:hypothetical protein